MITIHADYLKELLKPTKENALLQIITSADQPVLFEEIISPKIHEVASEIIIAHLFQSQRNILLPELNKGL